MEQLYYELILKGADQEDTVWFRKASGLPFVSPLGTSYDVPLFSDQSLFVCGYAHEQDSAGREALYMVLGEFGTPPSPIHPTVETNSIAEARRVLVELECWEEMDENDEPISST